MEELYYIARKAKQQDQEAMSEVLCRFEPKIKSSSRFVHPSIREDLEQELKMQVVKAVERFSPQSTPDFWKFMDQLNSRNS